MMTALIKKEINEYSGWFYISCPLIWKSLLDPFLCIPNHNFC